MENLSIALVQVDLIWEAPNKNRVKLEKLIASIEDADVVVLPEMFTTGFSMSPSHFAEAMNGETLEWMKSISIERNIVLTGSVIIEDNGNYYNRLLWVEPKRVLHYDKRHLFSLAGEEKHYSAGQDRLIVEYKGWRICPLICYDLRFPVWSRNTEEIDVYLYVANWPNKRAYPWSQLLLARAIENLAYVVAVNRVGDDGNSIAHSGDSVVVSPLGEKLLECTPFKEEVRQIELDQQSLKDTRNRFQFLNDRDSYSLKDK